MWIHFERSHVFQIVPLVRFLSQNSIKCSIQIHRVSNVLVCRRSCPLNNLFKYITQNDVNGVVEAMCLVCNTKLREPKSGPILQHYRRCSTKRQITIEARDAIIAANIDKPSNEIEYVFETAVTQRELDGQRRAKNGISAPGFLVSIIMTPKGWKRVSQCQVCKKTVQRPSQVYFTHHR